MRKALVFLVLTIAVGLFGTYQNKRKANHVANDTWVNIRADILELDETLLQELTRINETEVELNSLQNLWRQKRIGFVIYDNNHAADWTSNAIPFPIEFDERKPPKEGIVKLKNSWFLSRSKADGNQLLVAYALLRTNYDFQNRYISNQWSPSIRGDSRFTFTLSESEQTVDLTDGTSEIGLRFVDTSQGSDISWDSIIWLAFILFLLLTLWHAGNWMEVVSSSRVSFFMLLFLTATIRVLMQWLELPQAIYDQEVFGPTPHATSNLIPSLGDFLLHLLFLFLIVLRLSKQPIQFNKAWQQKLVGVLIPIILLWPIHYLFEILVVNSSFSLDLNSPFSLNLYSFIGLVITFLILLNYYVISSWLIKTIDNSGRTLRAILLPLAISALMLGLMLGFDSSAMLVSVVGATVVLFLILAQKWIKNKDGIYKLTPTVLAFSVLACIMLTNIDAENEKDSRIAIARKIDQQQNPITEYLFEGLASDFESSRTLRLHLSESPINPKAVLEDIHEKLDYDHWNRYQCIVDVFSQSGGVMVSDRELTGPNFSELQKQFDECLPTISKRLRYVGDASSGGGYLARIELDGKRNQEGLVLFIRLIPEKTDNILGFTDLFVAEEISTAKELQGYSYALYRHGELKDEHGDYSFSLSDYPYKQFSAEHSFFKSDGFSHLVYRPNDETVVVVSRKLNGLLGYLTTFSYLFFLYLLCSASISLFSGQLISNLSENRSFRNRINLAMSVVSFISLVLIGLLTVFYVIREYNARNEEMISEKSRSVLIEMEHKLRDRESFTKADEAMLSTLLAKFSKVFFTDINLYELDGSLLATSRPRLFDEGLMAKVIDPTAYNQMRFAQKSSFIQQETIGNLNYLTAYVPFRNEKREVIAFMSLPYFARQYGLQQEIFSLLAALTNIYVFLILISVVLALFISNRITEPLRFIRESLQNLRLDETNRAIEWSSKDEIGELVDEYNRTLNELVRSAELLARSERESAWREMAKQVAHEIKNPLTPMKLSIQMLQRSKNDGAEDLSERIDKVTKTLIEQIDTLSNIATEFSSFAQMPKSNVEAIDMKLLLESATALYRNSETEMNLRIHASADLIVEADREQMLRVFNNLIKNGLQAIPDERTPNITIGLEVKNGFCIVSVQDNGSGIPDDLRDKIFVPNFTTKSSGMGLGLAMVKNIVESTGGEISFNSESEIGTTFYVSLPLVAGRDLELTK